MGHFTYLRILSFPPPDQTSLLEFLHLLTSNCKVVFSHNNRDEEFIACITHWLLVIGLGKIQSDLDRLSIASEEKEPLMRGIYHCYNNNIYNNLSYLYRLICSVTKLLLSIKDLYITK